MTHTQTLQPDLHRLADELFQRDQQRVFRRTDRLFAWLMVGQWIGAVLVALVVSPRTWIGTRSQTHLHVWAALVLGGIITSLPVFLVLRRPGTVLTRHVIAVAQMLYSALLIHVTGGRIETHFHVFGSLAILSFYRDWKVLVPATIVVAADHFFRGVFYPESVYGVLVASKWRFLEHAWWVVFEDVFLAASCLRGTQEMREIAERTVALQQSEARTRLIVDTALDAVVTMDAGGRITGWNNQAAVIFGWSPQEAIGRQLAETVIPPALRAAHAEGLRRFLQTGEGAILNQRIEITALRRDGQEFPVEVAISPMRAGDSIIFSAFIRDIAQRKRSEQELRSAKEAAEAANKAKSEFLANMSHEIRTPMNGVIGMIDLLSGTNLDERQRRHMAVAKSSAASLLSLLNDILDFSKIEAGRLELDAVDFDLAVAVEDVAETFAERAQKKGLELAVHLDEQFQHRVRGDQDRLRQVLVNLINNAVKFTERGHVIIRGNCVEQTADTIVVRFTVTDTGIGIAKDRIDRLFKSFSQVDASTTRKYGGTGLGLAISKQLVELMGGTMGVASQPGEGTTFWFTVRLQPLAEDATRASRHVVNSDDVRVLVVSQSPVVRGVLVEQLRSWKVESCIADTGRLALANAKAAADAAKPFRIAIVDAGLTDMRAEELAQRLKANNGTSPIAVMLICELNAVWEPERREHAGFCGCITKPIRQSALFDHIMRGMTQKSAPDARPAAAVASPPAHRPPAAAATEAANVLLVEDNEVNQMVAVEILRDAGYAVEVAGNGRVALDLLEQSAQSSRPVDLILMDCQMPEMDGFETAALIRQREARESRDGNAKRIPIIALTANAMKGDRERCLACGMNGYISKPIDAAELLQTMRAFLPGGKSPSPTGAAAAHPSSSAGEDLPLDLGPLLRRCMGKTQFAERMLEKFAAQSSEYLDLLVAALRERQPRDVERAAHTIKGMAANVSAEALRSVAAELEQSARSDDLDAVAQKVAALRQEIDRCLAALPRINAKLAQAESTQTKGAPCASSSSMMTGWPWRSCATRWRKSATRSFAPTAPARAWKSFGPATVTS